jgi:uncharacterized membrane protein YccC
MTGSVLNAYLLTNKVAVRTAIKVSISVWGALVIALLMNFEHPVWAMITGMISFFAPDHAQVVKKCLFQCISTVLGGLLGLLLMAFTAQSPFMMALLVAAVIFVSASLSYHTRDGNFTFCCAIFSVTVVIIVMIPGFIGPTSEEFIVIFIDRIGAIIVGIAWAALVSAALWPVYSTDMLCGTSRKLVDALFHLNSDFALDDNALRSKMAAIYSTLIECEDLANHCSLEGHWGQRAAKVAREMNRVSVEIVSESYALHQLQSDEQHAVARELQRLTEAAASMPLDRVRRTPHEMDSLTEFIWELNGSIAKDRMIVEFTGRSLLLTKLHNLALQLKSLADLYGSLLRAEKIDVEGTRIKRHFQFRNSVTTGLRSSLLFLIVFGLWYATGWGQGFLITIVPVVFSIMLGKLPHPEIILKKIVIGTAIGIPVGLAVFILLAQAPSAVELLILTAGGVLFFGLMGLSSLMSFPYSLGFCLSYMILVLPLNTPALALNVPFAIERSLSVGIGAAILALLYVLLPRRPLFKEGTSTASLFEADLRQIILTNRHGNGAANALKHRVGLVIDKLVAASLEVEPATRAALVDKAGQCIFLMTQVSKVDAYLEGIGMPVRSDALKPWKTELYRNYLFDGRQNQHRLVDGVAPILLLDGVSTSDTKISRDHYLRECDYLIRRVFKSLPLQETLQ